MSSSPGQHLDYNLLGDPEARIDLDINQYGLELENETQEEVGLPMTTTPKTKTKLLPYVYASWV